MNDTVGNFYESAKSTTSTLQELELEERQLQPSSADLARTSKGEANKTGSSGLFFFRPTSNNSGTGYYGEGWQGIMGEWMILWETFTKQPNQLPPLFNNLNGKRERIGLWILLIYFILLIIFSDFFETYWDISLDKNTITFRNYLSVLGQIGLSSNLQGCIVHGILPVPRVIRHTDRLQLSAIVSHKTSSRLCNRYR